MLYIFLIKLMVLYTFLLGLYRYEVDDVLEVTGFHNNAPQFRFSRRKNVVISIQTEATTEVDLLKAVNQGKLSFYNHRILC